jgi:hypothetical protein
VKPLLADVWLPWFLTPYLAGLFAPWLAGIALLGEAATFYVFQRHAARWWVVAIAVLCTNLVSAIVGYLLFLNIPDPPRTLVKSLPFLSFIPAFLLSVAIEYGVYVAVPPWRRFSRLFTATTISNVVSYAILGVGAWLLWRD